MTPTIAALAGALARASAFAATVPLLPHQATPRTVRAGLALTLVPLLLIAEPTRVGADAMVPIVIDEGIVGAAFGLSAAVVASAVNAAGDMIDAALGSPAFLERAAAGGPVSRLYQIAFAVVLLQSGGLVTMIERFVRAGAGVPHHLTSGHALVALGGASIAASLSLAGPALFAQALATVVAGMLARAAPQLNGMLLSAPLASGSVLISLALGASILWPELVEIVRQAISLSRS